MKHYFKWMVVIIVMICGNPINIHSDNVSVEEALHIAKRSVVSDDNTIIKDKVKLTYLGGFESVKYMSSDNLLKVKLKVPTSNINTRLIVLGLLSGKVYNSVLWPQGLPALDIQLPQISDDYVVVDLQVDGESVDSMKVKVNSK